MQLFNLSAGIQVTSQILVRCCYLLALLGRGNVDFGPFLECLPQDLSDQWLTSNLQGNHVAGAIQHCLWGGELAEKCSSKVL